MSVFHSAYDTLACLGFANAQVQVKKSLLSVLMSRGDNPDYTADTPALNTPIPLVTINGASWHADVGYFAHPITMEIPSSLSPRYKHVTFVDARNYGYWRSDRWLVNNLPEVELQTVRACLNHIFTLAQPSFLKDVHVMPGQVYALLVAQSLQRAYMLNPSEMVVVSVVAAYFYCCLFEEDDGFEEVRERVLLKAAMYSKAPASDVARIMDGVGMIGTLEELAEQIKLRTGSVRLQHFNYVALLQFTAGNWIGHGSREMLGAALEHPPSWIAMVYGAVQEATYRRTNMGKIVESCSRGSADEQFIKNVNMLTGFATLRKQMAEDLQRK